MMFLIQDLHIAFVAIAMKKITIVTHAPLLFALKKILSVWIMGGIKFTAITEAGGIIIFYVFYASIQCAAVWCYSGNHVKTWIQAAVYITEATLSFNSVTSKPSKTPPPPPSFFSSSNSKEKMLKPRAETVSADYPLCLMMGVTAVCFSGRAANMLADTTTYTVCFLLELKWKVATWTCVNLRRNQKGLYLSEENAHIPVIPKTLQIKVSVSTLFFCV